MGSRTCRVHTGVGAIQLRGQNGNYKERATRSIHTDLPTGCDLTGDLLVVLGIFLHCDQEIGN
jgi:hypothetical protein